MKTIALRLALFLIGTQLANRGQELVEAAFGPADKLPRLRRRPRLSGHVNLDLSDFVPAERPAPHYVPGQRVLAPVWFANADETWSDGVPETGELREARILSQHPEGDYLVGFARSSATGPARGEELRPLDLVQREAEGTAE